MRRLDKILLAIALGLAMAVVTVACGKNLGFLENPLPPEPVEAPPCVTPAEPEVVAEEPQIPPVETPPPGPSVDLDVAAPEADLDAPEEEVKEPEGVEPVGSQKQEIWVLVDISEQHLWLYQGEEILVECDVVTGNAKNHATPPGEFTLRTKSRNATLRGYNDNGTRYASPVSYWMPFNGGIGLHDATWRKESEFGGTTYQGNGSHGCVNMPLEAAKEVYELVKPGITRIVVQD